MIGFDRLTCDTGSLFGSMVLGRAVFACQTGAVKPGYTATNQVPLLIRNPVGSGVDLELLCISVALSSGVMSPGEVLMGFGTATDFLGSIVGQPVTPGACLAGVSTYAAKGAVFSGFVGTNNGINYTPDQAGAWPVAVLPAFGDTTPPTQPKRVTNNLSGMFVLAPGTIMTVSLSPRPANSMGIGFVTYGLTWAEEPVAERRPRCDERPRSKGLET